MSKSAGKLKYFLNNWKKITSDSRILTWIQGYEIPFTRLVFQYSIPGQPSWSSKNKSLISDQIQKLILKGTICKCSPRVDQFVSSIFLVPKSNGTSRLILNLKKLYDFIETNHFKLEDFRLACKLVSPNWFMGKLDLKDAYYMVPIKKNYRKYLRFFFDGIFFEFNCLPFGLNTAPYVFTKIMKPVVGHLRNQGFLSIIYLDDLLLIGNSYSKCLENIKASMNLLTSLGFIINEEKSYKVPSQVCGFLGFILNSQRMTLELPSEKRRKIHDQIITFKKLKNCKIKDFAQLIGSLVSCCPAIQYSWAHIKSFERERYLALLKSNDNYEASMALSQELQADFLWWEKNGLHKVSSISAHKFTITIFSDASLTGWGLSCGNSRAHGHWNVSERLQNINYLELLSAFFGLQCFARDLRNCSILLRIDNTTAISYINRMGGVRFKNLSKLSRSIWEWCEERDLYIFASYVSSKDNAEADFESRRLDIETEFELSHSAFIRVVMKFGNPEIDLFASRINAKCKNYVSWMRDPASSAVDAFTISWGNFFFYAFPPFIIIPRVLQKIKSQKAKGIFVVPYWPAQSWFPLFLSMLESDFIVFNPNRNLLFSPDRKPHPLWRKLTLVAGKLSGELS